MLDNVALARIEVIVLVCSVGSLRNGWDFVLSVVVCQVNENSGVSAEEDDDVV